MNVTLQNECLTVRISALGAELRSIVGRSDGWEYLWQADPQVWGQSAPWLFPICGRLYGGQYTYRGKTYEMGCHGFASQFVYEVDRLSDTEAVLTLRDNEETRVSYPFSFLFSVHYRLEGRRLIATATATNTGEGVMPATFGAH
ncbi:MAG: aldose 1-epimerase family protein, partial [Clostridia bacterium]|nr:aldose 1-epimerase family protein [Clostridia bacterium]